MYLFRLTNNSINCLFRSCTFFVWRTGQPSTYLHRLVYLLHLTSDQTKLSLRLLTYSLLILLIPIILLRYVLCCYLDTYDTYLLFFPYALMFEEES